MDDISDFIIIFFKMRLINGTKSCIISVQLISSAVLSGRKPDPVIHILLKVLGIGMHGPKLVHLDHLIVELHPVEFCKH